MTKDCLVKFNSPINADIYYTGMTMRDYSAKTVLSAVYADYIKHAAEYGLTPDWRVGVAKDAYEMADAMMKVRDSAS